MSRAPGQDAVLQTSKLTKVFSLGFRMKKVEAVRGLDLEVRRGETFGFLGPNGAGKTTTIKICTGLIYPTSGQALHFGRPVDDPGAKGRIGFMPENPYFYDYLKPVEFLKFCTQLHGIPRKKRGALIDELLELVGLSEARTRPLRKFSKGMLQRIGIAQALVNDPELVILDEPLSGLDPIGRKEIRDLISNLKKRGKTVFFSTHILGDAEMLCDRVAIIHRGRLKDVGRLDQLLSPRTLSCEIIIGGLGADKIRQLGPTITQLEERAEAIQCTMEDEESAEALLRAVLRENGRVISVTPRRESLEDLFMREVAADDT